MALLEEFDADADADPGGTPFGLLVALYPVADGRTDAAREPIDD